jgi:hypothetical protein
MSESSGAVCLLCLPVTALCPNVWGPMETVYLVLLRRGVGRTVPGVASGQQGGHRLGVSLAELNVECVYS